MPISEMALKLNTESVRGCLSARKGWKRRSNKLTKDFVFVNRVATLADSHDHHPDIDFFTKNTYFGCARSG